MTFVQTNITSQSAQSRPVGYDMLGADECWEWRSYKQKRGYGIMSDPVTKKRVLAHRWMYEQHSGAPVPAGYECHHVCENKGCVNPAHIELVTKSEHRTRHWSQTHCLYGHELTKENTYRHATGRICKTCQKEQYRKRVANKFRATLANAKADE